MKNLLFILIMVLPCIIVAQDVPQGFNYQGVARDADNEVFENKDIALKISILNNANGTIAYAERHEVVTSDLGVFSLVIGSGSPLNGSFSNIPWGDGEYLLKTELDPNGGTDYINMGKSKLFSVPYALYAANGGGGGEQGPKGDKGDKGDPGDIGPTGPKGDKGDDGEQGPKGDTGDAGPAGPQGEAGSYEEGSGINISEGVISAEDASPENELQTISLEGNILTLSNGGGEVTLTTGTGEQGPKGDKGDKGDPGDIGPVGPKGDKGDDGEQGPKGDTGDAGPAGPKGDKGDDGEQGPKGDTGDAGPAGPQGEAGSYEEGSGINISEGVISAEDASPENELQTISLDGNTITLSNGGGEVTLPNEGLTLPFYGEIDQDTSGFHVHHRSAGDGQFAIIGTEGDDFNPISSFYRGGVLGQSEQVGVLGNGEVGVFGATTEIKGNGVYGGAWGSNATGVVAYAPREGGIGLSSVGDSIGIVGLSINLGGILRGKQALLARGAITIEPGLVDRGTSIINYNPDTLNNLHQQTFIKDEGSQDRLYHKLSYRQRAEGEDEFPSFQDLYTINSIYGGYTEHTFNGGVQIKDNFPSLSIEVPGSDPAYFNNMVMSTESLSEGSVFSLNQMTGSVSPGSIASNPLLNIISNQTLSPSGLGGIHQMYGEIQVDGIAIMNTKVPYSQTSENAKLLIDIPDEDNANSCIIASNNSSLISTARLANAQGTVIQSVGDVGGEFIGQTYSIVAKGNATFDKTISIGESDEANKPYVGTFFPNNAGKPLYFSSGGAGASARFVALYPNVGLIPMGTRNTDLGASNNRWNTIYAKNPLNTPSDRRLKTDIKSLDSSLEKVMAMRPVSYTWIDKSDEDTHLGFIAQEMEQILPEVVTAPRMIESIDGTIDETSYNMSYTELIPVLTQAIQELKKECDDLKAEVDRLKAKVGE